MTAAGVPRERDTAAWAAIEIRYAGYLERERDMVDRLLEMEDFVLPTDSDYLGFLSVSFEAREKLARIRPTSLGQAARIPGVSPSDLHGILLEIRRAAIA